MSANPWPQTLDLSEEEARRILRSLELSAYSSVIAALRAQGGLSNSKRVLIDQLQTLLG